MNHASMEGCVIVLTDDIYVTVVWDIMENTVRGLMFVNYMILVVSTAWNVEPLGAMIICASVMKVLRIRLG